MKRQVLAEEVNQIIQQSFWGMGGVKLTESTETQPEVAPQAEDQGQDAEMVEEAVEAHVCPLCESTLEQDISDEQLAEHVNFMVDIINEMGDITDEEIDEIVEAAEEDQDAEDLDEAYGKKAMKKKMPMPKKG